MHEEIKKVKKNSYFLNETFNDVNNSLYTQ